MPYVLLKREPVANPAPATDYSVYSWFYDTTARRVFPDTVQSATNTGAAAPFELTIDALVPGASFCRGTTRREVRYAGGGAVYTQDVAGSILCATTLTGLTLTASGTPTFFDNVQALGVSWLLGVAPFTVRCGLMEGATKETPPYYDEIVVTGRLASFPANAQGGSSGPMGGGRDNRGPYRTVTTAATGLPAGRYRVQVEDAAGAVVEQELLIDPTRPGDSNRIALLTSATPTAGTRVVGGAAPLAIEAYLSAAGGGGFTLNYLGLLLPVPATGTVLLALTIAKRSASESVLNTAFWDGTGVALRGAALADSTLGLPPGANVGDRLPDFTYYAPAGLRVGFTAAGHDVCSNGRGGVYVRRPNPRLLRLENIIYFHPDTPTGTGGVLVEVAEQADPDCPALTFYLCDATFVVLESNATGRFGGMAAGDYQVVVGSADPQQQPLTVPLTLRARYALWRTLAFDDLENHVICRAELWLRDHDGLPAALCGTGEPVVLTTEGLEGGPLQADLPDAVGTSLTLNLLAEPGELEDLVLEDRVCRADFYYGDTLKFRGYVQPETFVTPLLSGQQAVTLTATDGLAALKDTDFAGHIGQELRGRRPILNTLLHCLSRCDVTLPLRFYSNRKAEEMTTAEALELAGYTDRLAYVDDKGKALDCRTVVDACCQALGGTLCQRDGQWQLRTPLEAAAPTPGRAYTAAGTPLAAPAPTPAPAAAVRPPQVATAAAYDWLWLNAGQQRHRRAGWKSFSAEADAGYAKQAFRQGDYFGQAFTWTPGGSALQPAAGWVPGAGSGAAVFALALAEATAKAGEYAAVWPAPITGTGPGGGGTVFSGVGSFSNTVLRPVASNYLESEPAPLMAGREGLAMRLTLRARAVGNNGTDSTVLVEVVSTNAAGVLSSFGHVFTVPGSTSQQVQAFAVDVPFGLFAGTTRPRLRLHPVQEVGRRNSRTTGAVPLLVESLTIELLPQRAEWEGKQSFTALGPGGTVRPQEPLAVFHPDVPAAAGLFEGNVFAFRRAISRGISGPTTAWARPADLLPAPLLASAVLDVLALRGNPSQLLTGTVRHRQSAGGAAHNPEFGDAMDAPHDVNGRRWFVAARTWRVKAAETDITVLEIGPGEYITPPLYALPAGVLLTEFGSSTYGGESFPDYFTTEDGAPRLIE